ncbi:MAG: cytochrome c maturation protein CcmE [Kofleriaceae bacterium]
MIRRGVLLLVLAIGCDRVDLAPPVTYKMVDELLATDLARWKGRSLRVHGYVKPGSIVLGAEERTFIIQKGGKELAAAIQGPVPDTFKDGMEVIATGQLFERVDRSGYRLGVTELSAKCPSTYEGVPGGRGSGSAPPRFQ